MSTRKKTLLVAALVSLVLVGALYGIAVHTEIGQRVDHSIFESRKVEPLAVREDAAALLKTVSHTTLALLTTALILLAWAEGGWRPALAVGGAVTGAVLSSELLKAGLPRPGLIDIDLQHLTHNSFPSGHATIAMAVGLALVLATPARGRRWTAIAATLFAVVFGLATVLGGWHRPSDTLAGYLIALAWTCAVTLLLLTGSDSVGGKPAVRPGSMVARWCSAIGAALLLLWLGLLSLLLIEFEWAGPVPMFEVELLTALAIIAVSAMIIVRWWLAHQSTEHQSMGHRRRG